MGDDDCCATKTSLRCEAQVIIIRAGCPAVCLAGCLASCLAVWLSGWLSVCLSGCLAGWLAGGLADWLCICRGANTRNLSYTSLCTVVRMVFCLSTQTNASFHRDYYSLDYLSVCLSVCLSVRLSVRLSVCLSVCLSVYLCAYLSVFVTFGPYNFLLCKQFLLLNLK